MIARDFGLSIDEVSTGSGSDRVIVAAIRRLRGLKPGRSLPVLMLCFGHVRSSGKLSATAETVSRSIS